MDKTWLLCGPVHLPKAEGSVSEIEHLPGFETDYLTQIGGETNPDIKPGKTFNHDGQILCFFSL